MRNLTVVLLALASLAPAALAIEGAFLFAEGVIAVERPSTGCRSDAAFATLTTSASEFVPNLELATVECGTYLLRYVDCEMDAGGVIACDADDLTLRLRPDGAFEAIEPGYFWHGTLTRVS